MHHNGSSSSSKAKLKLSVSYTEFSGLKPHQKPRFHQEVPWSMFVERMTNPKEYSEKKKCPLLSLSEYGDILSDNGVFRHGKNILNVWGCEFDYDGAGSAPMSITEARDRLQAAGIQALLHTSSSHTTEDPHWRVLFPFSRPLSVSERSREVAKANEILGGTATKESFTISQAYYFGKVKGAEYEVYATDGVAIDTITGLAGIGKKGSSGNGHTYNETTDEELREAFKLGVGRYEAMQTLSSRWAIRGFSISDIVSSFESMFDDSEIDSTNADGIDLRKRIKPLAESAVTKYGDSRKIVVPQITIKRKIDAIKPALTLPVMPDCVVCDIVEWVRKRSLNINPHLDLAVGLTAISLATLNRYLVSEWNTPLQMYTLALASTGTGKSEAQKALFDFARKVSTGRGGLNLNEKIFSGFQSYHAFFDQLVAEPHIACWAWDEAARDFRSASRNEGGQDFRVLTHILNMYGRANSVMPAMPARGITIPEIEHPFLVVLAMAQPDAFISAVTERDLDTGLIPRFLLLDSGDKVPKRNDYRSDLFSARIGRVCRGISSDSRDRFTTVTFDSSIRAKWLELDDLCRARMEKGGLTRGIWSRVLQQALMIAGLLAVSRSTTHPIITTDLYDYAVALTTQSAATWISRLGTEAAGTSWHDKLQKKIEGLLRKPETAIDKAGRSKQKDLIREGWVPRTNLMRRVRSTKRKDADDVLDMLAEGELISRKLIDGMTCYRWIGDE